MSFIYFSKLFWCFTNEKPHETIFTSTSQVELVSESKYNPSLRDINLLCDICLERKRNIFYEPCGHCVCEECNDMILKKKRTCPFCRQNIKQCLKVFPITYYNQQNND